MTSSFNVIEGHCHLASTKAVPEAFFRGVAMNMAASAKGQGRSIREDAMLNVLLAQHGDHYGDRLVSEHQEAGVSGAVLLVPDFSYALESELSYREVIYHHIQVCKRHQGHFYLFPGVDPRWGHEALSFFEMLVKNGFANGLKLYPPCGFSPSDPICYPLYEICKSYDIPVLLHTGPTSPALTFRYADPFLLDDAAKDFPEVRFIAAHGAVNYWKEHLMLAKFRPNIFLDVSGFHAVVGECGWREHLKKILSEGLNHKLIFGTDWPIFRAQGTMKSLLSEFFSEDGVLSSLSECDVKKFMFYNISSVIGCSPIGEQHDFSILKIQ